MAEFDVWSEESIFLHNVPFWKIFFVKSLQFPHFKNRLISSVFFGYFFLYLFCHFQAYLRTCSFNSPF